jgi:hypothetical protein
VTQSNVLLVRRDAWGGLLQILREFRGPKPWHVSLQQCALRLAGKVERRELTDYVATMGMHLACRDSAKNLSWPFGSLSPVWRSFDTHRKEREFPASRELGSSSIKGARFKTALWKFCFIRAPIVRASPGFIAMGKLSAHTLLRSGSCEKVASELRSGRRDSPPGHSIFSEGRKSLAPMDCHRIGTRTPRCLLQRRSAVGSMRRQSW